MQAKKCFIPFSSGIIPNRSLLSLILVKSDFYYFALFSDGFIFDFHLCNLLKEKSVDTLNTVFLLG